MNVLTSICFFYFWIFNNIVKTKQRFHRKLQNKIIYLFINPISPFKHHILIHIDIFFPQTQLANVIFAYVAMQNSFFGVRLRNMTNITWKFIHRIKTFTFGIQKIYSWKIMTRRTYFAIWTEGGTETRGALVVTTDPGKYGNTTSRTRKALGLLRLFVNNEN